TNGGHDQIARRRSETIRVREIEKSFEQRSRGNFTRQIDGLLGAADADLAVAEQLHFQLAGRGRAVVMQMNVKAVAAFVADVDRGLGERAPQIPVRRLGLTGSLD